MALYMEHNEPDPLGHLEQKAEDPFICAVRRNGDVNVECILLAPFPLRCLSL